MELNTSIKKQYDLLTALKLLSNDDEDLKLIKGIVKDLLDDMKLIFLILKFTGDNNYFSNNR